jgi:tRNA(fMet)-specific endonuclease VapC
MSLFVLDTDILSLFQKGDANVSTNVANHANLGLATTAINVEEQLSGWYTLIRKAKTPDKIAHAYSQLSKTVPFLATFQIMTFDVPSIQRFESLRKMKLNIRKNDLRIAAIVIENGATLVTRNARDFQQVPGLVFVDWSQ